MGRNDEIDRLKKIRAPLWSRLLGSMRARRRAKKARKRLWLLINVTVWARRGDGFWYPSWFTLYVSGEGKRSFKFHRGVISLPYYYQYQGYHEYVVPWLLGQFTNQQIKELGKHAKIQPH